MSESIGLFSTKFSRFADQGIASPRDLSMLYRITDTGLAGQHDERLQLKS